MFNEEQMAQMLRIQDELNKATIGPKWEHKGINFPLAILMECTEGIEYMAWKWWKKQEQNIPAAQMELVDIFHFAMSDAMCHYTDMDYKDLASMFALWYKESDAILSVSTLSFYLPECTVVELFTAIAGQAAGRNISHRAIFELSRRLGMTFKDLYRLYCSKAVLNKFRQENGYREGTYKKIWGKDVITERPLEDNDYVQGILPELDWNSDQAAMMLASYLAEKYTTVLAS